jgi:putative SOS response-associated peptidase YedK
VFLPPELARDWMTAGSEDAMAMLMAAPMPELRVVPVSKAINSSRNRGGPESIEPVDA